MAASVGSTLPAVRHVDELSRLCQELFCSLARSDQRRWGEVYVRGLTSVPGRKSIRRISDFVVGWRADQCLQQFVNQSPWRWEPVRCGLAQQVAAKVRPRAWAIEEAVFPKNGDSSVGVAKQYATSARKMLNCQLGLAVFMVDDEASVPVNWRLLLPRCWDDDEHRRERTGLPEEERHHSRWHYLLEALDEMIIDWGLNPAPIIVDASQERQVEPLLRGLEERGLHYVVRVSEHTPAPPTQWSVRAARTLTVGELALLSARQGRVTLNWRERSGGRLITSQFATAVLSGAPGGQVVPARGIQRGRRVLAEWSTGRRRPDAVWLTNINASRLPELINLARLSPRASEELNRLHDDFGLRHFEGRSFRGWHHHVTLVSVAHAYSVFCQMEDQATSVLPLRPYA